MDLFRSRPPPAPTVPTGVEDSKRQRPGGSLAPNEQPSQLRLTYNEVCRRVSERYPDEQPSVILNKLILDDVDRDATGATDEPPGYTGGKTLACYLHSIKHHERLVALGGPTAWMSRQQEKYGYYPTQYGCLQRAIEFLPELAAGLARASAPLPAEVASQMSLALPPRHTAEVGRDAKSRGEIRAACMDSLQHSGAYMASLEAHAAAGGASNIFTEKPRAQRGRLLGPGEMAGARRFVQAKLNTSMLRDADSEEEEEEVEGEEIDDNSRDPFIERTDDNDDAQPPLPRGFQYEPPHVGTSLLGWNVKATFPTGPQRELRWHDGYIFCIVTLSRAAGASYKYQVFYPVDYGDEWIIGDELPDTGFCFRKPSLPNARASQEAIARAKASIRCHGEEGRGGDEQQQQQRAASSGSTNAAMRARADFH